MPDELTLGTAQPRTLAVLHFAGIRVALEQHELGDLESAAAVQGPDAGASVGSVVNRGRRWPVHALDASLHPVAGRHAARRICVMLTLGEQRMGLLVEDVTLLDPRQATIHPLPESMRLPGTPIRTLLRAGGPGRSEAVIVLTDAAALAWRAGVRAAYRAVTSVEVPSQASIPALAPAPAKAATQMPTHTLAEAPTQAPAHAPRSTAASAAA